jgi:hypothetical protein
MNMNNKFEKDLRESCKRAADFLRKKHQGYNDAIGLKGNDRLYSGEREFVAEVYRLLICNDPSYWEKLFFEAIRPDKGEESGKLIPDLVYRNGNHEKCVMEVKAPVNNRADGSELPWETDRKDIEDDYEKLEDNYDQFDKKFLIVAYLGDPVIKNGKGFPLEDFEKWIHSKFPDKGKIKLIVC